MPHRVLKNFVVLEGKATPGPRRPLEHKNDVDENVHVYVSGTGSSVSCPYGIP